MPRGKRSAPAGEEPKVQRRRGRPRKETEAAAPPEAGPDVLPISSPDPASSDQDAKIAEAEAEIICKYPDRRFKPGSLLPAGSRRRIRPQTQHRHPLLGMRRRETGRHQRHLPRQSLRPMHQEGPQQEGQEKRG